MKIEIIILDNHDFINTYKHFYSNPPKLSVTLEAIKEYIDNELPKLDTHKITIKKWDENR